MPHPSARRLAAVLLLPLLGLGGCKAWDDLVGTPATNKPPTGVHLRTPTPDVGSASDIVTDNDLVGDWKAKDPQDQWVVHFKADGTYVEDFQGIEGLRSGTYKLKYGHVQLIGGDGETDSGAVKGETIVFHLGTLVRMAD